MASPSELSLDCKPHSYSLLLKSFGDQADHTYKLEDFLSRLEEERLKIDAFKRELPLCMQLLTNAMEASRQQLQAYKANQGTTRPVLEEFIPIKQPTTESSEKASNISDNKANWMTSAQLWSQANNEGTTKPQSTITSSSPTNKEADIGFMSSVSPKLALDNKQRINGGAFLPFSKERSSPSCHSNNSTLRVIPELALASVEKEMEDHHKKCIEAENASVSCPKRENSGKPSSGIVVSDQGKVAPSSVPSDPQTTNTTNNNTNQTHRKARRCWSPDLHRRFVNALQMLGGSQVATPKQIRELMKVDGLTNDEVKSHLQKYRLHTRRPSPSPQATGSPAPQLVVLGGIWVPPEYAAAAYSTHPTSHAPPPPYCSATAVHQEFYAPAQYQTVLHQHQLQMYNNKGNSSEEMRGERSESIEDGKSESSSWKGEMSGDNNNNNEAKRKGLPLPAPLTEDGEHTSRSDTTLKF